MPKLRVDDDVVANISQEVADELRAGARAGIGNVSQFQKTYGPPPSALQSGQFPTAEPLWEPNSLPIAIQITVQFPPLKLP